MRYYIEATARALAGLIVFTGAVLMLAMATSGCAAVDHVGNVGKGILIDCGKAEALRAANEIGPLVETLLTDNVDGEGHVNWDPVEEAATRWTAELGGCVLSDVIARALAPVSEDPKAPKSSALTPLQTHRDELRQGFEAFKSKRFGGVTFALPGGQKL